MRRFTCLLIFAVLFCEGIQQLVNRRTAVVTTVFTNPSVTTRRVRIEPATGDLWSAGYSGSKSELWKIDPVSGSGTKITGITIGSRDGALTHALFGYFAGFDVVNTPNTIVYVADENNARVRKVDVVGDEVTIVAGFTAGAADGIGVAAKFCRTLKDVVYIDNALYVADIENNALRKVNLTSQLVTTCAGKLNTPGTVDGPVSSARFGKIGGLAADRDGRIVYCTDMQYYNVRSVNLVTGMTHRIAGTHSVGFVDGAATSSKFHSPFGIGYHKSLRAVYLTEIFANRIRGVDLNTQIVTTIVDSGADAAAVDGPVSSSKFRLPRGVAMSEYDDWIYVADQSNSKIRKIKDEWAHDVIYPQVQIDQCFSHPDRPRTTCT